MDGENGNPRAGHGIGRSLEEAREGRGLSLREVEEGTRIRSRYLRALEREEFDVLPAVYVLGSLKTYGDFLGLDGAALSRRLKASLVEPEEPAEPAVARDRRDEDDGYVARPVWAVGFDQLFVGAGVILISILAIMTLVAAIAQGNESPVSQLRQPSTPEPPSEIALAGNFEGVAIPQSRLADDARNAENAENSKKDEPEKPKEDGEDQEAKEGQASIFGDAEFVPMSPSSSPASDGADASASASASPTSASATASAPATAPSSASPEPSDLTTDKPERSSASVGPEDASAPPDDASSPASAPARRPAAGSPEPGGGAGSVRARPARDGGGISATVGRRIDETFEKVGLD